MLAKRLSVALFALSVAIFAQTDRGTITGVVTDPAGAVVANAQLELRGTDTGTLYPSASSATGNYTFSQLPVGTYELTMTVAGFKKYTRQNIRVQASQTIPLDVQLEVGSSTESVTVSAEVTLLRTESSDVSTNVDSSRLTTLPILPIGNGYSSSHGVRNPMAVANLTPGTFFDPNLVVRVNGAPSNTMAIRVEGQDATNGVVTFSQAQTQPSVDALQELSVQSSNYAAEYGQAGSGVFNYTIKSGTNQFHGSVYNYFSNEFLNASQAFNSIRPRQRRNNYGGTIGGPVVIPKIYDGHDKTFFFFNYEAFREKGIVNTSNPTVPTDAYRAGSFSNLMTINRALTGSTGDVLGQRPIDGQIFDPLSTVLASDGRRIRTPFPNNTIPTSRFDPSSVKVLNLIPRATNGSLINNYNSPFPTDRKTPIPAVKIDHSFTAKAKISGYWSTTETAVQYCVPLCGSQGFPLPIEPTRGTFIESHTERINFDYTLTPTTLFHLGVGFQSNDFKDTSPVTNFDVEAVLGIKGAKRSATDGARFPQFVAFTGNNSTGGMSAMGPGAQSRSIEQKPTMNLSITSVRGNHTLKFGGEGRTEGYITDAFTNNSGQITIVADQTANPWFSDAGIVLGGGVTGHPFASFLLGQANQVVLSAPAKTRGGRMFLGAFVQDTWKVSRKLTFDYGLRYDYFTYSREQYGRTPNFSATTPNSTAAGRLGASIFEGVGPGRCNCSYAKNYPFAFGPRTGIAYQLNTKTVIRGGFGANYSSSPGGGQGAAGAAQTANAPGFADPAMILSQGYPVSPIWPDIRPNLFPDPRNFSGQPGLIDQNSGRPARQIQFSFGVQRELMNNLVVDVSYVGNRGAWWRTNTLNQYNGLTPEYLRSTHGLDITSAADRTILSAQIGQAAAGRFRNIVPFTGFPTTFSVARGLVPFPQFTAGGGITSAGPLGKTWYDSLQTKVTKRFSHGIDATFNFTWSKELQLGAENDNGGLAGQVNDVFNRNINKGFSSFSRPIWTTLALSYTTQKLGAGKLIDQVVAGWTLGTVLQYGSGQPIGVPNTRTANIGTALLRNTRSERVPGEPLFLKDLNCHCFDPAQTQVLNPNAWRDPAGGTFSSSAVYYNDYRFQRRPRETFSFGRMFQLREKIRLQVRAEFTNPLNRTQIPNPIIGSALVANSGSPATAQGTQVAPNGNRVNSTGFGYISTLPTTAVIGERSGLLVARIIF